MSGVARAPAARMGAAVAVPIARRMMSAMGAVADVREPVGEQYYSEPKAWRGSTLDKCVARSPHSSLWIHSQRNNGSRLLLLDNRTSSLQSRV